MAGFEQELCFYARIENFDGLSDAVSIENHVQAEYRVGDSKNKVRVRSTEKNGQVRYEETAKIYFEKDGMLACEEHSTDITEEFFNAWMKLYQVTCVKKRRYIFLSKQVTLEYDGKSFTLPEVKYEVDVFLNKDGLRYKWCKIDIEIQGLLETLKEQHVDVKDFEAKVALSKLPFDPKDAFSAVTDDQEKKDFAKQLWDAVAIQYTED